MVLEKDKKRSAAIDMVKGLSIMSLFFLHFENGYCNFDYNYFLVRSPAFYIVVGWLWGKSKKDRTIKQHWEKRKIGLIRPYICFSIIFLLFDLLMVLLGQIESFVLYRDIYKTIVLRGIGTLWFLPALLGGELLFLWMKHKKWRYKALSYLLCFYLIIIYYYWNLNNEHNNLNNIINAPFKVIMEACNAYIYITLAFYFSKKFRDRIVSKNSISLFIFGIIILSIDFFIMNFMLSNRNLIMWNLLFIFAGMLSGIGALILFKSIENFKPISLPLVYCGKNSLVIMGFHFCLLFQIALIIDRNLFLHESYSGAITIMYFLVAVILQVIIIEFINRKTPYIIGK